MSRVQCWRRLRLGWRNAFPRSICSAPTQCASAEMGRHRQCTRAAAVGAEAFREVRRKAFGPWGGVSTTSTENPFQVKAMVFLMKKKMKGKTKGVVSIGRGGWLLLYGCWETSAPSFSQGSMQHPIPKILHETWVPFKSFLLYFKGSCPPLSPLLFLSPTLFLSQVQVQVTREGMVE